MFDRIQKLKGKIDPIAITEQIAGKLPGPLNNALVKNRLLDVVLNVGIPFNRWLGLRIKEFGPEGVTIESPETLLRRNHVGTAHACAQALIGEYAAGLVVAQTFPLETYRMIIGRLEIDYHKAGKGTLRGTARAPDVWPELENDEAWVEMRTEIRDEAGVEVAVCKTRWQIKSWAKIKADRESRTKNEA